VRVKLHRGFESLRLRQPDCRQTLGANRGSFCMLRTAVTRGPAVARARGAFQLSAQRHRRSGHPPPSPIDLLRRSGCAGDEEGEVPGTGGSRNRRSVMTVRAVRRPPPLRPHPVFVTCPCAITACDPVAKTLKTRTNADALPAASPLRPPREPSRPRPAPRPVRWLANGGDLPTIPRSRPPHGAPDPAGPPPSRGRSYMRL
jgi:hypothetical protein